MPEARGGPLGRAEPGISLGRRGGLIACAELSLMLKHALLAPPHIPIVTLHTTLPLTWLITSFFFSSCSIMHVDE